MTAGIYLPSNPQEALGRLERAFRLACDTEAVADKITAAISAGALPQGRPEQLAAPAVEKGIISRAEAQLMLEAEAACSDAVQVDSFTPEEYMAVIPAVPHTVAGARI